MSDKARRRGIYAFAPYKGWNNQQLTKNCGLVPYLFHKLWGWHAVMVGGKVGKYPALQDVPGLELDLLESPEMEYQLAYLEAHIDDMDVLVLHGVFPFYFHIVQRYRELRPDGKIYLEMDANNYYEDRIPQTPELLWFLGECDVIGASCRKIQEWLCTKWPICADYLPNGFYDLSGAYQAPDFSAKENIILEVARIGSPEKRTEDLMLAFAQIAGQFPDWQLRLVGGIDAHLLPFKEQFEREHPELDGRVVFTGGIYDKAKLYAEYRRAKIFALMSASEGGTPNVVSEALFGGCYMVTSDVDGAMDIIAGGACGMHYPIGDVRALADCLAKACADPALVLRGGQAALSYGREVFDFVKIVRRLRYLLFGEEELDGADFI